MPRRVSTCLVTCALLLVPSLASAAKSYLAVEPMTGKKVRIDGALLEWPGGFAPLDKKIQGSGASGEVLVGYDDQSLFIAAKLKDGKIVRTAAAGAGEDHLTVEIRFPSASGKAVVHRIDVYPGDPGKLPGVVKVDGKIVSGAEAVEAPQEGGLVLEARLPWSALPEAKTVRVGLRGKISYTDASSVGQTRGVGSTSDQEGARMPALPLAAEFGLIEALLEPKNLSLVPNRESFGDVAGKSELEKVALYGHFLSITGPGYRDGTQFYFSELDVERAEQVTRLELLDVNGDGKSEILLQKKLGTDRAYREVLQVLQIGADDAPQAIFSHEVSLVTEKGRVENRVRISGSGANARIEIAQGKEQGFDPGSFNEPTIGGGVESAILPWQSVESRTYGWKGKGIALLEEKAGKPKVKSSSKPSSSSSAPEVKAPPPPRPPTVDEMLDRVYALYKQDRGVKGKKPRFDFVTDVTGDDQTERVLVHDKDIVVFGKGFKQGLSYTFITMGVKDAADVLQVTSRDLTGDGKAEILVHAVLKAKASAELGGDEVARQALFVYSVLGESLTRVFAVETGRILEKNRVLGSVSFTPGKRGVTIDVRPLRALGWTQKNYPFPEDQHPAGGLEPLLLPWGTVGPRHYEFDGSAFVLR